MFRCGEDGENSSCCISEEVNTNTMNTALQKHYEKHLIETQPDDYRKSLEQRWKKLDNTHLYMLCFFRSVDANDKKHFQKLRKQVEEIVGYKIKKSYNSLTLMDYQNFILVDATNEEERVKRETLFTKILNNETERYMRGGNIFRSKFFTLFPNAECKELEEHLSPDIGMGLMVQPFGMTDYQMSSLDFHIHYRIPIHKKVENIYWYGMRSYKYDIDKRLEENDCTEEQYLKDFAEKLEVYENLLFEEQKSNSIHINDFLSHFPEIEKDIADEVSRKLKTQRKQVKVSMSFDFDLSMTVELDCLDEEDMRKKIEKVLEDGLENSTIPISKEMEYGDDFISILDTDCTRKMDYQVLETSASSSSVKYEEFVRDENMERFAW